MPWAAKNADDQLGRVIATLKAQGRVRRHADHRHRRPRLHLRRQGRPTATTCTTAATSAAGTPARGSPATPRRTVPNTADGPAALKPLMATGKIEFSYQSTAIESWLKTGQPHVGRPARRGARHEDPARRDRHLHQARRPLRAALLRAHDDRGRVRAGGRRHGQELVDTHGVLRAPRTSSACSPTRPCTRVYGDHGGAQKDVQRIPMAFYAKGMKHKDASRARLQLVDIMPTILRAMGIRAAGSRWTARLATWGSESQTRAPSPPDGDGRGARERAPAVSSYELRIPRGLVICRRGWTPQTA